MIMAFIVKEVLKDAIPLIEQFAPGIAGIIGGPSGVAIGIALPLIAKAFNTSPSDFGGLVHNIVTDPSVGDKLKALDAEHGGWLQGLAKEFPQPSHVEVNLKMDFSQP